MLPTTLGGEHVKWIVLDDASDTTRAVTNTRKLLSEDRVDVIVGSTITPNSLAMVDIVADAETPMVSMAASARSVDPATAMPELGVTEAHARLMADYLLKLD
jgi:branched-chain amino acid transport system substrate-binding protein